MSIPHTPHALTITLQTAVKDASSVVTHFVSGDSTTVKGCATQLTPGQSYDAFAEVPDVAYAFYVDPGIESFCVVGSVLTFNGQTYAVEKVQTNNQGLLTDHTVLYGTQRKKQ